MKWSDGTTWATWWPVLESGLFYALFLIICNASKLLSSHSLAEVALT